MPLLPPNRVKAFKATSTFVLGKRRSPQQCYLQRLCTTEDVSPCDKSSVPPKVDNKAQKVISVDDISPLPKTTAVSEVKMSVPEKSNVLRAHL